MNRRKDLKMNKRIFFKLLYQIRKETGRKGEREKGRSERNEEKKKGKRNRKESSREKSRVRLEGEEQIGQKKRRN